MSSEYKYFCGCGWNANWRVDGFGFEPKSPDKRGKPFNETCCDSSADYLTEASAELEFPCAKTRLP